MLSFSQCLRTRPDAKTNIPKADLSYFNNPGSLFSVGVEY